MSSNREKLTTINAELVALDEKQATLSWQDHELRESRSLIVKDIITEDKPFEGTKWELFLGAMNGTMSLRYIEGNKDKIEAVNNLCFHSWHESIELQDGVILHVDDNEYSLTAKEPRQLISFAQKQNFIIIASDIEDKVRRLSRQLGALQEVCHIFNLKV